MNASSAMQFRDAQSSLQNDFSFNPALFVIQKQNP